VGFEKRRWPPCCSLTTSSLSGRDRTQEEFCHTFNELQTSNRQIVLTADVVPESIAQLEPRPARGCGSRQRLMTGSTPPAKKVAQEDMDSLNIEYNAFHGEWNYALFPAERE
jgi:hypothetical protein